MSHFIQRICSFLARSVIAHGHAIPFFLQSAGNGRYPLTEIGLGWAAFGAREWSAGSVLLRHFLLFQILTQTFSDCGAVHWFVDNLQ